MTKNEKVYLGDSVYLTHDGGGFILTTENGLGPSNEIYLEIPVYRGLVAYASKVLGENNE